MWSWIASNRLVFKTNSSKTYDETRSFYNQLFFSDQKNVIKWKVKKCGLSIRWFHIIDEPTKIGPIFPKSEHLKIRYQWLFLRLDKTYFWYEKLKELMEKWTGFSRYLLANIWHIAFYWIDYLWAVIL